MRFLKIKYIVPLLIVIAVGVLVGLFFIGALGTTEIENDNIEFSEEGFIDFNTIQYDEDGKEYIADIKYNNSKLIGENDKYLLVFDEETTIGTIYKKGTGTAADYSDYEVVYTTAQTGTLSNNGANLIIDYAYKSNGRSLTTPLNSMQHSVKFFNSLTNQYEGHYKLKYLDDGGVQILYEIGKFSAGIDYFPRHFPVADFTAETMENFNGDKSAFIFNQSSLQGRFRGNTIFTSKRTEVKDDQGDVIYYIEEPTFNGTTYSPAAAEYIRENNLATVTESKGGEWMLTNISPELINGYGVHLNAPNSPVTSNPFYYSPLYTSSILSNNNYTDPDDTTDVYANTDFEYRDLNTRMGSLVIKDIYTALYISHEQTLRGLPVYDADLNPIIRGGFHAVDDEGNYLYDEDGKPVQALYSLAQVAKDNALFGVETATSLERFQVGLQMKLTDDGLQVAIISDSLKDADNGKEDPKYNHDYVLDKVSVLPKFTTVVPEVDENEEVIPSEGMIVIPDGSGAVIDFATWANKTGYADYGKSIYGRDYAFVLRSRPEKDQNIMFGMYGIMDFRAKKGVMAVVEKGAAQTSIFATVAKTELGAHAAYFNSKIRQNENVRAGGGWHIVTFPKWARNITDIDMVYHYIFLNEDEMGYVELAKRYREYLIDLYNLEAKDNTTDNLVDLDFLGAFERYDIFLGFRYMKDDSLTTFSQAQEIVDDLLDNDVDTLSVGYLSWTKDEMEPKIRPSLKASQILGGSKGIQTLNKYLEGKGIKFYPQFNVGTGKGYGYSFGSFKYTARGVANDTAVQYPFNLATLQVDRDLNPTYYLSPNFYRSHIERMLPSYNKLNINGAFIPDIGNLTVGNYRANHEVYPGEGVLLQMDALQLLMEEKQNLKVLSPFDYAFPYINLATSVPTEASFYGVFDYSIPFYQLVTNGLFDYTMEYVNGTSDKSVEWFLVKALETGSNLQFLLSYEDPKILLETDYTMYYKAYYQNWKKYIIDMNKEINDIGIHQGRLVDHRVLGSGLVQVTYEIPGKTDLVLLLNTSNIAITQGVDTYAPYSYKVVGGGI